MVTRLTLGSCLSILCLFWASIRPTGLAFFPPSSFSKELMGGDQTIPALFVPRLPGAQGLSGIMAQPGEANMRWGVRSYYLQHA